MDCDTATLEKAAEEYRKRKSRGKHPDGQFDGGGRWYPSAPERQDCCSRIRQPSRSYPYSLMVHCRTARHVAQLYGVPEAELRSKLVRKQAPEREGGKMFKVVGISPAGKLVSVYDGETEYVLGRELRNRARQGHVSGLYCYKDPADAENGQFPHQSRAGAHLRVLLRVEASGSYCRYPCQCLGCQYGHASHADKLAFSRMTPREVLKPVSHAASIRLSSKGYREWLTQFLEPYTLDSDGNWQLEVPDDG